MAHNYLTDLNQEQRRAVKHGVSKPDGEKSEEAPTPKA
jgi:hypothetical protein